MTNSSLLIFSSSPNMPKNTPTRTPLPMMNAKSRTIINILIIFPTFPFFFFSGFLFFVFLVFLFTSDDYSGDIISETAEGKVYWMDESELKKTKLADDFDKLIEVFEYEKINEMVYEDNGNKDEKVRWDLKLY